MPDRGLLERTSFPVASRFTGGEPWRLRGARWAQITFEVARSASLESMPDEVSRPVPCYGRLFVLAATEGPAGPFSLAALTIGGRHQMMPRNVLVEGVVEGDLGAFEAAYGGGFRSGKVTVERINGTVTARVGSEEGPLAELHLPALRALDSNMLRWDPWLGYGGEGTDAHLVEFGPRMESGEAFLSKGATVETGFELLRGHRWRRLRSLGTISACYVEGELTLTAPAKPVPLLG